MRDLIRLRTQSPVHQCPPLTAHICEGYPLSVSVLPNIPYSPYQTHPDPAILHTDPPLPPCPPSAPPSYGPCSALHIPSLTWFPALPSSALPYGPSLSSLHTALLLPSPYVPPEHAHDSPPPLASPSPYTVRRCEGSPLPSAPNHPSTDASSLPAKQPKPAKQPA